RPPSSPLFPYTTLFRSVRSVAAIHVCRSVAGYSAMEQAARGDTRDVCSTGRHGAEHVRLLWIGPLPLDNRTDSADLRCDCAWRGDRKSTRLNSSHVSIS